MRTPGPGFHALAAALVAGLCALLYAPALDAPFLLDDWEAIVHNPHDRWSELSLANLRAAVTGPRVKRPTAHVSFGLNHWLAGDAPRAYRQVNVAIHAAASLGVYFLGLALLGRARRIDPEGSPGERVAPLAALTAALWFAAHPVQVQAVTYVVQRMASLAAMLYLAALGLWLLAAGRAPGARAALRGLAVATGLLALGSKEIAVALPFALWLVHGAFEVDWDRAWLRRTLPAVGLAAVLGLLGLLALGLRQHSAWAPHDFGPGERLLTQPRVLLFYLSLVALPLPSRLNLLHDFEPSRSLVDPPSTLAAALALAALLVLAVAGRRRHRWLSFALLWFALHSALEAGPLPLRMAFEHRLYLPLAGPCIAAGAGLFVVCRSRPALAVGLAVCVTALLGAGTLARNAVFRDTDALWTDTVRKSPDEWLARMQWGSVLARAGRFDEAHAALDEAVRLAPASPRPHNLRGALLRAQGRLEEALEAHRTAARLDPGDPVAYREGATVAAALGRLDEAAALLAAAHERSGDPRLLHRLGRVREAQGRTDEALALFARAAAADPGHVAPRAAAARLLAREGRAREAAARLDEAVAAARRAGDADALVRLEALRATLAPPDAP